MNTEVLKYDPQKRNDAAKSRRMRRRLFSKVSPHAVLTAEEQEILKAAQDARDEWIEASSNFEYVNEEMLVDYYTYKLKACESRYTYFVRLAKEKGISSCI